MRCYYPGMPHVSVGFPQNYGFLQSFFWFVLRKMVLFMLCILSQELHPLANDYKAKSGL